MKKYILLLAAAVVAGFSLQAKTVDEFRIYLNPGHGSYGANDRPMPTIGHPHTGQLNAEGTTWIDTDTLGFYEGRGTLPRAFGIGSYLKSVGVSSENIVYSRLANGPWPYTTPNSEYDPDAIYNKNLADICEEVEEGNFDMFISSHSNAATDGTSTNYPLFLYRGYDTGQTGAAGYNGPGVEGSDDMARTVWPYHYMGDIEPQSHYSATSMNVRGDISFYGSYSTATRNNGKQYSGYLGVLKHGVPGYLLEGFFHTYQPSRHRALNFDYDRLEGIREARGVATYWGFDLNGKGEIAGTVKDMHEKINDNLYKYAYGTDDQWLPLNGAQVVLKKDGTQVATYTVDNEWNGFFAFFDLEPGNYTVEATAEGYKLLDEPIAATVTANNTCYSFVKLENENYVPEEEVYENYPDPVQPSYLGLAGTYVFGQDEGTTYDGVVGNLVQSLQYGDSTIVLSHEGTLAHLYIVDNNTKQVVKQLNTEGLFTMENNPGFYNQIGSIALSADRKLVGVTAVRTSFADGNVPSGYQRGTMHAYYWNDFDSAPTDWFSTQYSSNWYNADLGWGVAVSGPIKECIVCVPAPTSGSSRGIRPAFFAIADGNVVSTSRANANATIALTELGDPQATEGNIDSYPVENFGRIKVAVSPFDDQAFIIGGSKCGKLYEFPVTADGGIPTYNIFTADEQLLGNGLQIFKYAHHTLLVAPYGTKNDVKGIKIYDVTNGLANATLIKTVNTDLATSNGKAITANAANFAWAGATVDSEDIHAYLVGSDVNVVKFATDAEGVEQPKVKGIYAYDLNYSYDGGAYTFTFKANEDANEAYITFTNPTTGEILLTLPIENVVAGTNEVVVQGDQFPALDGENRTLIWEISLVGDPIARIDVLNNPDDYTFNRIGNAVDVNPESPYFGRFYLVNRIGSSNTSNAIYAYTPEGEQIGGPISGEYTLGNPFRLAIDQNGTVYLANWADGDRSGVFKLNPETLSGDLEPFFVGTHASNGAITNADGDVMCTSTPSVFIAGTGADTHMYCHLEDAGNDIAQYNIGNADGSIMENWTAAPTRLWGVGGKLASTHAAVVGESEEGGIWVVQNRSAGNNNAGVPSIMYVDPEGTITYNSGTEGNPIHEHLTGTQYCGGALSPDGTELVVNQPDGTLKFFEVAYNRGTPTLTWKYDYKHNVGNLVTQINYDYAGNLFVSAGKLAILSMPTEENMHSTPSKMELVVPTGINDVKTDAGKKVVSVSYVNVAGIESSTPFQGVNIVVTRYEDGSQTTTKVIK